MKCRADGASIINLGSVAGREAYAGGAIYCATKVRPTSSPAPADSNSSSGGPAFILGHAPPRAHRHQDPRH